MAIVLAGIDLESVSDIHTEENRILVEHQIGDGSIFQDMGRGATTISFNGIFYGEKATENLEKIREKFKAGEPALFVADILTATDVSQVLIEYLTVNEFGGKPEHFRYSIVLKEYVAPPPEEEEEEEEETEDIADQLDEPVLCRELSGIHFSFARSFIRPFSRPKLQEIADYVNSQADRKVVIVGHTDRVGTNSYNQQLSERRARSVYAYLTNDTQEWVTLCDEEGWGTIRESGERPAEEYQYILSDLGYYAGTIDGIKNPATTQAIRDFQSAQSLQVDGIVGPQTWRALFEEYFEKERPTIPEAKFLETPWFGCGEERPRVDVQYRLEKNRRVEFLLFKIGFEPEVVDINIYDQYTIIYEDISPITITVILKLDNDEPFANRTFILTKPGGETENRQTDTNGECVIDNMPRGEYFLEIAGGGFGLQVEAGPGEVRGNQVFMRLNSSAQITIVLTPLPVTLDFIDISNNPITDILLETPFKLKAEIPGATQDEVVVTLSSYIIRRQ